MGNILRFTQTEDTLSPNSEKQRQDDLLDFSFKTALIFLEFAWMSYFDEPFETEEIKEMKEDEKMIKPILSENQSLEHKILQLDDEKEETQAALTTKAALPVNVSASQEPRRQSQQLETKPESDEKKAETEEEKKKETKDFDLRKHGFKLHAKFKNEDTDTNCFVATRANIIVISFRGTASLENARTNLWFSRSDLVTDFGGRTLNMAEVHSDGIFESGMSCFRNACKCLSGFGIVNGSIHSGFQNSYRSVQAFVLDHVLNLITNLEIQGQTPIIYLVGHSLGGALATICAYDLKCRLPELKLVFTPTDVQELETISSHGGSMTSLNMLIDLSVIEISSRPFQNSCACTSTAGKKFTLIQEEIMSFNQCSLRRQCLRRRNGA
eukprot:TRINITY_DN11446_c0_g1_i1.p1 TRINITY_DN11446_c0_g1~~TRINITY_DN11446_c0_g1_i1.p1  ORF type:complete len:382 (-),score=85.56 TRINITY_DN11446_c0_g1_i1:920-2065(-)